MHEDIIHGLSLGAKAGWDSLGNYDIQKHSYIWRDLERHMHAQGKTHA